MTVTPMYDVGGFGRLADVKMKNKADARAERKLRVSEQISEQNLELGQLQIEQTKSNLQKIQENARIQKGLGQALQSIPKGENQFTTSYNYFMMQGRSDLASKYSKQQSDKIERIYKMDKKAGIELFNDTIGRQTGTILEYIKEDPVQGDIILMKDTRTGKQTYGSRTKSGKFVPLPGYLEKVEDPAKSTKTTDIKEYEYAKKNSGFKGTLKDWKAKTGSKTDKTPTPQHALKRISDISKTIATLEKTDTITQLLAKDNPELAQYIGQTLDPEKKAALMKAWNDELDYLEKFSGTSRKKVVTKPDNVPTHTFVPGQGLVPVGQ